MSGSSRLAGVPTDPRLAPVTLLRDACARSGVHLASWQRAAVLEVWDGLRASVDAGQEPWIMWLDESECAAPFLRALRAMVDRYVTLLDLELGKDL